MRRFVLFLTVLVCFMAGSMMPKIIKLEQVEQPCVRTITWQPTMPYAAEHEEQMTEAEEEAYLEWWADQLERQKEEKLECGQ